MLYTVNHYIFARDYNSLISKQVHSRIHNSRESVIYHCYQIICSNLSVQMFNHWTYNVI